MVLMCIITISIEEHAYVHGRQRILRVTKMWNTTCVLKVRLQPVWICHTLILTRIAVVRRDLITA